jgi:hypothetical protein
LCAKIFKQFIAVGVLFMLMEISCVKNLLYFLMSATSLSKIRIEKKCNKQNHLNNETSYEKGFFQEYYKLLTAVTNEQSYNNEY